MFTALINASRGYAPGGGLEDVDMEAVFYVEFSGVEHVLYTSTITSSDFNGIYLAYYNSGQTTGEYGGPNIGNNNVKLILPQALQSGTVKVKYRYKDSSGTWQPNSGSGYTVVGVS